MSTAARTRRSSAAARNRRSSAATTGRFSRTATPPRTMLRRNAAPQRRAIAGGWLQRRRRPQKQSALKRMLSGVSGAMPGRKGAGGLAVLAGAAGLALKNRDKVASMARRRGTSTGPGDPAKV